MKKYLLKIPMLIVSGIIGYMGGTFIGETIAKQGFIYVVYMIVFFILTLYIQLILHEAGHLVFGLMSGYRFLSFRIGSFTIQKEEDGYKIKRYKLAGTAGQCILIAPDDKFPFVLYNLGGILVNLICGIISVLLCKVIENDVLYIFFALNAFSSFIIFVSNGFPSIIGGVANDGYNTMEMLRSKQARIAFWKQLKINEYQTKGIRLKDMDPDLFEVDGDYKNVLISSILVFKENRYMDAHEFSKAKELIEFILSDEVNVIGIYENLLKNDYMYISLLENEMYEFDKKCIRFRKNMKNFPSIIRTDYALKVCHQEDGEKELELFHKVMKSYPIKADEESETELIDIINEKQSRG